MTQNDTFIDKYIKYKNLCCECRYDEALAVFNELLELVTLEHEELTQYVVGSLLKEASDSQTITTHP